MKRLLAIILCLSGLMPLFVGITGLASYTRVLEMFKVASGTGSLELVTIMAACMVPLGVIQFIAGFWVWKNDWHGVVMARFIGALILFDGLAMYSILHRADIAGMDIAKGIVILGLSLLVRKVKLQAA